MQTVVDLVVFLVWLAESRFIFRYMIRNDTIKRYYPKCSHGCYRLHRGQACHQRLPTPHGLVAVIAMLAACLGPIALIPIVIMYRPPMSKLEQHEYIEKLIAENNKLRAIQERIKHDDLQLPE